MGVICRDNEEWCEIGRGIDCRFKIDFRKLTTFDPGTRKSQKFAL